MAKESGILPTSGKTSTRIKRTYWATKANERREWGRAGGPTLQYGSGFLALSKYPRLGGPYHGKLHRRSLLCR